MMPTYLNVNVASKRSGFGNNARERLVQIDRRLFISEVGRDPWIPKCDQN